MYIYIYGNVTPLFPILVNNKSILCYDRSGSGSKAAILRDARERQKLLRKRMLMSFLGRMLRRKVSLGASTVL